MSATKKGKKTRKPLIILTAGGTGGHVYPAEALADELLRRGYRVELITDSRGKDNYKGRPRRNSQSCGSGRRSGRQIPPVQNQKPD